MGVKAPLRLSSKGRECCRTKKFVEAVKNGGSKFKDCEK